MRKNVSVLLSLALLCLLSSLSLAQVLAGGSITGTVSDGTGAVVSGANVTARNLATNAVYNTTSDNSGLFVFPIVKVGIYAIKAEKTGFATVNLDHVTVAVGSKLDLPLVFRVAGSTEQVNVSSEAPLIETERTSVASNVNERAIENLPTNGRNFLDFVTLTPGVVRDPNRGGDLSFAGMRGTANSLTVDGNDDNNSFYGQAAARVGFKAPSQFSQDAVQEFQVASNGYSAEIGRASGAVVNAVTKSGSNQFHGDLFEFYRDQSMNAYDPITKQNYYIKNPVNGIGHKSKYHYNQFGGSVGGPIVKDRLFFFFNLDDQRNVVPNAVNPLPTMSSIVSAYNSAKGTTLSGPTAEMTAGYNYLQARDANWNKKNDQNSYLLKLDGNINSKNQASARWNRQRFTAANQETSGGTVALEGTGNSYIHTDNVNVSLTSTITPKMVNQARVAYLRDREPGTANSSLPEAVVSNGSTTLLQVGRNYFSPRETTIRQQQYSDNVTYMLGRHTIKVGGDAVVAKIKNYFPGNFSGQYSFNYLEDFGCSLGGFTPGTTVNGVTCGQPTYYQAFAGSGTSGATTHPDTFQPSFFAQDDFRITRKVTVNIGMRYDYQGTKKSGVRNDSLYALGFDTAQQKIKNDEWAPRFGFAYDALGNGKLVVRGGYGIFYGTTNSMLLGTAMSNNGINVSNYTFTTATTVPTYPNPLSNSGSTSSSKPSVWVVAKDFKNPMVQQGNFGVEYALDNITSFSAGYMWVKGDHLPQTLDQNPTNPVLSSVVDENNVSHPYYKYTGQLSSSYTNINLFQSEASSQYNALVVEVKRRFTKNFQGSFNYTWAHAIDNNPDATAVTSGGGDFAKEPMYPSMTGLDRGNAGADVRHRFNLSYVYTPVYTLHNKIADAILVGWSTSGILTVQSGLPYSAMISTGSTDLLGTGNKSNVRDMLVGRNSLRMPRTWELDPRISRDIKLPREGMKFTIFGEAFNVLNHFNVSSVKTTKYNYSSSTGKLTTQTPSTNATSYFGLPNMSSPTQRILQLGAKFIF